MTGLDLRELECALVLGEELHFGRTAERLYLSQGRVSQLLRSLEDRLGARLFDRTSRRVRPTPFGARFLTELRPAYTGLHGVVEQARAAARGVLGVLRLGFVGMFDEPLSELTGTFGRQNPACHLEFVELPLSDPFGAVRRGEVDAALVLGPVHEPDLMLGATFARHPQTLVLAARHALAAREALSAEELAGCPLIDVAGPAPRYWRESMAPTSTPAGLPIPRGPRISTLQEGLSMIAADRGAMLFCAPTAAALWRRDLGVVPVTGLPEASRALIWHRDAETAAHRALAQVIVDHERASHEGAV
ncbi:LysR family transcriptional regulator [Kutzneria albida]|uniref:Putative transcription regulator n=1 Tax=Kutzneria albida DSM 43870 TaxID=1449976 RepID=W5W6C4_9PSEU|nr:LysR family transcriptional regulator [Kutzneria albida]AHH96056.1 putative transcription regulator [Kutzneria albida DSM 43870]